MLEDEVAAIPYLIDELIGHFSDLFVAGGVSGWLEQVEPHFFELRGDFEFAFSLQAGAKGRFAWV